MQHFPEITYIASPSKWCVFFFFLGKNVVFQIQVIDVQSTEVLVECSKRSENFAWLCVIHASWWFQPIWKILVSHIGNLPQVGVKIKHIWNHHLDMYCAHDFRRGRRQSFGMRNPTKQHQQQTNKSMLASHCITENFTYHDPIIENLTYHGPQNFASTSSAEMPCFFSTFACTRAWRQLGCLNNLIWGALPTSDVFYLWKLGSHRKIPPFSIFNGKYIDIISGCSMIVILVLRDH